MFQHLMEDGEEYKLFLHHSISFPPGGRYKGGRSTKYYVTNFGRVFRHSKTVTKFLTPTNTRSYYYTINTPVKTYSLHRLVAQHFLPDFNPDLCVCHEKETLPPHLINRADNLWMGTHKENERDKVSKGRNHRGNQFVVNDKAWVRLFTTDNLIIDVPWDSRHTWLESYGMKYAGLLNLRRANRKHPYKGITHFEVIHL